VGETEYGTLSEEEQRSLDFFIWVGCGCHKDLNTVKGGNVAMMAWWLENDIEGPILLANKDNAAVLQRIQSEADVTPIEQRAIDCKRWSCGGGAALEDLLIELQSLDCARSVHKSFISYGFFGLS